MQETEDLLTNDLEITGAFKDQLIGIAAWARLLSIVSLVCCVLMIGSAIFTGLFISRIMHYRYGFSFGSLISALYIFFAVVWFFPSILLYRFSARLNSAIKNNIQENIESAFFDLKSLFKFLAIGTGVILLVWMLSFLMLVVKNL